MTFFGDDLSDDVFCDEGKENDRGGHDGCAEELRSSKQWVFFEIADNANDAGHGWNLSWRGADASGESMIDEKGMFWGGGLLIGVGEGDGTHFAGGGPGRRGKDFSESYGSLNFLFA